jgi:hypothetical protein
VAEKVEVERLARLRPELGDGLFDLLGVEGGARKGRKRARFRHGKRHVEACEVRHRREKDR